MGDFSKHAIWRAVNSEFGDRLVEIVKEHATIARELAENRRHITEGDRKILATRIEALRLERDKILERFEEDESDA